MKWTSPEKRSDIIYMHGESLQLWIKAQNVPIPYRLYHTTENIQSLAEQVWDAIQNGTLLDLRNKLSNGRLDKGKEAQIREDLKKMTGGDLQYWIGCKNVSIGCGSSTTRKGSDILTLAETVWDAIKADTLDSLPKRNQAPPNKVKEPTAKEDFKRMTKADIMLWQSSKGLPVKNQDKMKARAIALGERTWDAIQNDTLNELKSDYNARHGQTDAEIAAEAVLTKSGISSTSLEYETNSSMYLRASKLLREKVLGQTKRTAFCMQFSKNDDACVLINRAEVWPRRIGQNRKPQIGRDRHLLNDRIKISGLNCLICF